MNEGDLGNGERGSSRVWIEAGEGVAPGPREEYGGSSSRGSPADLGFTPNEQRVVDLRILHALCDDETPPGVDKGLTPNEREAFESMRDALEAPVRKFETLTTRQREWAMRRAEELNVGMSDPAERNANVPRGREVASRAAQLGLPLAPPTRTTGKGLDALFSPGPFEETAGGPHDDDAGPEQQPSGYMRIEATTMPEAIAEAAAKNPPSFTSSRPSSPARRRPQPIRSPK